MCYFRNVYVSDKTRMLNADYIILVILATLSSLSSDPVFSRSHSQPDVDLSRPPELHLHHQSNLSVPTGYYYQEHSSLLFKPYVVVLAFLLTLQRVFFKSSCITNMNIYILCFNLQSTVYRCF